MKQCPQCGKRFLADDVRRCDADGAALQVVIVASSKDRLVNTVVEGRYRVDNVLGDGGMGVVYKATGLADGRAYAVKVLRAEYSDEPDLVNRFQLEAESVQRIDHENIVKVFEFGVLPDGSRYFVMEYLEGRSLGQLLAKQPKVLGTDRHHPLGDALTIDIAGQMCSGLQAAHDLGIVHRDMKPDNVHLLEIAPNQYRVKILDFGIAKVQGSNAARTRTGSVFGTPHYMSPEQAQGDRNIDARTDVYAVGVLMYQMATGRVPFDAENLMGILTAHLYQHPKPFRDVLGAGIVSDALEAVIFKALAKAREDRYDSMSDLQNDLETVLRGGRPRALDDDVATARVSAEEAAAAREWRANMPAPGSGKHNSAETVPVGRISMRPDPPSGMNPVSPPSGPMSVVVSPSIPPGMPPGFTQQSIPPVIGVAPKRPRGSWLVVGLLSVGALAFVGAGMIAFRHPEPHNVPSSAPVLVSNPAATNPAIPTPPAANAALSATIRVETVPPGATVFRGTTPIGPAPLDVPRPVAGTQDALTIDRPGSVRTAVMLSHDSPASVSVALVAMPTTPNPPDRPGRTGSRSGNGSSGSSGTGTSNGSNSGTSGGAHRDLIDPWDQH